MSDKNSSAGKLRLIGGVYLVLFIIGLNSICTQFIAYRVNTIRHLGPSLFGQLYMPFDWWRWLFKFYDSAPNSYNYAFVIFALGVCWSVCLTYVLWIGFKTRSSRKHEDVHGTAHFAHAGRGARNEAYCRVRASKGRASTAGAYDDPETGTTYYLRHDGPEHVCALAPTRSGKGVGLVIPTLLSWPHSVFVLDRKGENYAMTSGWRQKHANNVILRFDPAKPGTGCAWNRWAKSVPHPLSGQ
ncbi:type IV secretory system conjugative DNA transfer family protein [Escherichia coli]|uniref:type IV secretory system conjugative DNA transfer family protein n=1 Tax=Escherichia coli TaxID=562 RepID=UPI00389008DF